MEKSNQISISVLKGDKLFNEHTPFVINISAPEPKDDEKKCNADLICVIDISGSMSGEKIQLVRESLKILVEMMDKSDRLALVLFDNQASIFYDLNYMTDKEKSTLKKEIDKIDSNGGTNILSGLEKAVEILKTIKDDKNNTNRVSSIILLSDGCDNYSNDIQLAESLKKLTKGLNLSFTLNTFGYGYDHDPKIMNKLANIRDGSFFLVEDYKKVSEYFVSVLGGCVSVISKKVDLCVQLLNKKCKMVKIFGEENLYSYELKPSFFKTSMLQFICGKEYTFVLEINIDEKEVKIGEDLLNIDFSYADITNNDKVVKINNKYQYELTDIQISKANDEYIRSQVYYVLSEALKLREQNKNENAKKLLENMENWLKKNNNEKNKTYLEDILKTKNMFNDEHIFRTQGISYISSNIRERQSKRVGTTMMYQNNIQANYSRKAKAISYNNKFI
jgi:Mg-chelatase subunit ChlD